MIGNGTTATLASTTALASTGGQARRSAGSDGGFAETLDQAMKGETPGASGRGGSETAETTDTTPDAVRTKQDDFLAAARWRNAAGDEASTESEEAGIDEAVAGQTASETEIVEAVRLPGAPTDDASGQDDEAPEEAGNGTAGPATPSAQSTAVDPDVAAANASVEDLSSASGESEVPADAARKKSEEAGGETSAEAQVAATNTGDRPSVRKAGETAAASGETGRTRKGASTDQTGSRPADGAASAPVTADAASNSAVRGQGDTASGTGAVSAARSGAGATAAPAAPASDASAPAPELKPDTPANTGGKAEPAVVTDTAIDRASKTVAATAQTNTATAAQASAADKPAQTASVFQMTQASATGGAASPAGQVAEAVARDIEELAPTRVTVTSNGTPNRPLRSMQLQLNPAELGTVNIRLHSVDGQLHVAIRAESDKTAEMLSRDSDAIRSALRAAGVSSSDITVSVNRNDQTSQQFTGQNRDTSGQFAGQDNRGNTSNESRNPNREAPSGNSRSPLGRGNADSGDADGHDRLFI
tara:strand:+ start:23618 stop:25219 length:1602 start_codon:yes stop_codon:yes gene_type:complete